MLVMPDGNWLAHTSRPLEVAKLLRKIGHDIVFAGEGNYMELPRKRIPDISYYTFDPKPGKFT